MKSDPVNHPHHYCSHPSGVECILITENMNFNVGNAFKYLYRCTDKGYTLNDLKKSQWYINRELELRANLRFKWENESFDATFDGCDHIQRILSFESRLNGWMKQALERFYTASRQKRGVLALEAVRTCVGNMIQIQEYRDSKVL